MRAARHPREAERLAALQSYSVLDTPREAEFDDLVGLASRLCDTPVALVTLLDADRQWFKAAVGVDIPERPYEESLCSHIILERGLTEVSDLTRDPRFADNAVVAGEPNLRFYAGVPLEDPQGLPIGTFCVIDVRPRELTDVQRETLRILGRQAMTQLELRRQIREGEDEQKQTQQVLAEAEIGTWRYDVTTGLVSGNPLAERFYGVEGAVPLSAIVEAIHPDDRARRAAAHAEAVRTGRPYEVEYRATGTGGVERWLLARGEASHDEEGRTAFLGGVAIDITSRKRAELALAAERQQFRRLLDAVPGHVVTMRGPELRYDFANHAFLDFLGRPGDFLGQTIEEAWPVPADHVAMLQGILSTGEPVVGNESPVGESLFDFLFLPLREADDTVSGVFVHSLDVTEKVRAREALVRAEERFRVAQEMTPDAFAMLEAVRDEHGVIVDFRWGYVNPSTERLAGSTKEELLGESYLAVRPEARVSGLFDAYVGVVETGEPIAREFATSHRGRELHLRLTAVRVGDAVAVSFSDITDRQRAEERLREAVEARTKELREAFEEAERFNYSISHDLRTPLRAVSATAQVLLDELGPELSEEHHELLARQSHNARRMGGLIDALLRLSRLGRVEMVRTELDMTALARSVAEEIALAGESPCAVEVQNGMRAEGDPALVRLVVANLLENACKFSRGRGTVRVAQDGPIFSVSDEGVGFDMRHATRLFQPFERLVAEGEFPGTGIGLANVERIVRRHGGRVWAESAPGQGATFRFTLNESPPGTAK